MGEDPHERLGTMACTSMAGKYRAASRLISGDNHLMLGWEPSAEATLVGWLS